MFQKIIAILLLSFLTLSCTAQTMEQPDDDKEVINIFKGQSLEESIALLKEIDSLFTQRKELVDLVSEIDNAQFVGGRQFYENAFPKIDSTELLSQETELLGLKFIQDSNYQIKGFNKQPYGLYKWKNGKTLLKINHRPKAIYYNDGTVETKNIGHLEVPSEDAIILIKPWPTTKRIDSIAIDVTFSFPIVMDTISLSTKDNHKKYQSKSIQLSQLEANSVVITYKDFPEIVGYNAFTKNNKALKEHSSRFSYYDSNNSTYFADYQSFYKSLLKKVESKDIKSSKALVSYMEKNIPSQKKLLGDIYFNATFRGEVDRIDLYVSTQDFSKTITYMAKPYKK